MSVINEKQVDKVLIFVLTLLSIFFKSAHVFFSEQGDIIMRKKSEQKSRTFYTKIICEILEKKHCRPTYKTC